MAAKSPAGSMSEANDYFEAISDQLNRRPAPVKPMDMQKSA